MRDLGDRDDVQAWFICRLPRSESRWMLRRPESNATGAVPQ